MRRVVITGMGCVTPVGNDLPSFWNSITAGRHGIGPITKFDTADSKVKIAAEVKDFDPTAYIEKADIKKTDLYAQYAVATASQAYADAGLDGADIDRERFGVYIGSGIGGMKTFIDETEKLLTRGQSRISPYFIPMMIANIASAQVAIKFKAYGPCLPVVTACATATQSIGEAFRAVKHGYADIILAGGAEACINSLAVGGFANSMALSKSSDPDCASIPFDRRRDGFVLGEGSGIIALEEYGHARARGARIYCEVCGYGNTNDAYHITAPHPEAAQSSRAIRLALEESGLRPYGEELYINAHGTSTLLNDKTETLAIKLALGELAYKSAVSSTKSMTGHTLGAAGGIEAIVSAMAISTGIIPPTVGYSDPDPDCDLDYVPGKAREGRVAVAMSTSFGFGGHNACLVFGKTD